MNAPSKLLVVGTMPPRTEAVVRNLTANGYEVLTALFRVRRHFTQVESKNPTWFYWDVYAGMRGTKVV